MSWWNRMFSPDEDPLVSMAMLVKGMDREEPGWKEIRIIRRLDRPEGGADMLVIGDGHNERVKETAH